MDFGSKLIVLALITFSVLIGLEGNFYQAFVFFCLTVSPFVCAVVTRMYAYRWADVGQGWKWDLCSIVGYAVCCVTLLLVAEKSRELEYVLAFLGTASYAIADVYQTWLGHGRRQT